MRKRFFFFFSSLMHQTVPLRLSVHWKCAVLVLLGALQFGRTYSAGLDRKNCNQTISADKHTILANSMSFLFTDRHTSEEITDSHGFC